MVTFWGQKQPKKPPPTPQALSEMGDFYVTRMEPPAGCYLAKRTQQQHTALAGKPLHTCLLGLKYLFSATGLRKTKNILMVLSRHCKVKKKKPTKQQKNLKIVSPLCPETADVNISLELFTPPTQFLSGKAHNNEKNKTKTHRFLAIISQTLLLPPPPKKKQANRTRK